MTPDRDVLKREIEALPREIAPERDLWPEIAARLEPRARVGGLRRYLPLAAAAILLMVLSSGVTLWLTGRGPAGEPTAPRVALAGIETAEARRDLLAAFESSRDRLPPATVAVVEENLAIIERAMGEIEAALAEHPGDPGLELQLARLSRREIDLLRSTAVSHNL